MVVVQVNLSATVREVHNFDPNDKLDIRGGQWERVLDKRMLVVEND